MSPLGEAFRKAMQKGAPARAPSDHAFEPAVNDSAEATPAPSAGGTTGATRLMDRAVPAGGTQPLDLSGRGFVAAFAGNPLDPAGDQLAGLRAALSASGLGRPPATILVAGADPECGTTTVAAGLALALAKDLVSNVLVMDANVARPGLGAALEVAPELDILDVLHGRTEVADALVYSEADNLRALTLRPGLNAHAFAGPTADEVFGQLSRAFDYIVIDAGDAVRSAAAKVLAKRASSAVLVLPAGIARSRAREARSALTSAGGKILGAVLTGAVGS